MINNSEVKQNVCDEINNTGDKIGLVYVALAGKTNAGKSSLMNLLIGTKAAIVSDKPQTTRVNINGIITTDDVQYVFIDSPGLHKPQSGLSSRMLRSARAAVSDADVVLFMADASEFHHIGKYERELLERVKRDEVPAVLLLNKIDLMRDKSRLLPIISQWKEAFLFDEIIPVSVKNKDGTDGILKMLARYKTDSPYIFDEMTATNQSEHFFLSEILREKLLNELREELPHGLAVRVEEMKHSDSGEIEISFVIVCEKKSHKGMIIGRRGELLKRIGTAARKEIRGYFDCPVRLNMWVKVAEEWRNRESLIKEYFDDGIIEM